MHQNGFTASNPKSHNRTHLLSGKKRIALKFTGLDDNSVGHGEIYMSIVDCNKVQCPL